MPDCRQDNIDLGEIYPDLTEDELSEAEENLRRYLAVVRRISDRIQTENPKILTELRRRVSLRRQKAHS